VLLPVLITFRQQLVQLALNKRVQSKQVDKQMVEQPTIPLKMLSLKK
jgi:hypothetical protein